MLAFVQTRSVDRRGNPIRGELEQLEYTIDPLPGQTVTFVEEGAGLHAVIGRVSRAKGVLRFTPAAGRKERRKISALVEQDGRPRTTLTAGAYQALGPPPVPALRKVTVKRTATGASIRWPRARGAYAYEATVVLPGKPAQVIQVKTPRIAVAIPEPLTGGRVSVRVLDKTLRTGEALPRSPSPRRFLEQLR